MLKPTEEDMTRATEIVCFVSCDLKGKPTRCNNRVCRKQRDGVAQMLVDDRERFREQLARHIDGVSSGGYCKDCATAVRTLAPAQITNSSGGET